MTWNDGAQHRYLQVGALGPTGPPDATEEVESRQGTTQTRRSACRRERGAPRREIEVRVPDGGCRDEGFVPDRMSGRGKAEQRELAWRGPLDELDPRGRRGLGLGRVVADPVLAGKLEARVQQEARTAGRGEVDTTMEDVGTVREQRAAHPRRGPLGGVQLRIAVGHDERRGCGPPSASGTATR